MTLSLGANAQFRVYHEIGGSIGPTLVAGDWGRNSSAGKVFGYDGVEVNLIHNVQMIRSNFGLKTNLGFAYTSNKHNKDEWTGNGSEDPSSEQIKLAAMSGNSTILSLGTQLEYNLFDFGMYYPRSSWTPYAGIGFNLLYYNSSVDTPKGVPGVYGEHGIYNESGSTTSFKLSAGAKFKISRFISMFGELTLQRSYSDKIDGLIPQASLGTDYLSSFNIGMKYSFR